MSRPAPGTRTTPASPPASGTRAGRPTCPASAAAPGLPGLPSLGTSRPAMRGVHQGRQPELRQPQNASAGGWLATLVTWTLVGLNVFSIWSSGFTRTSSTTSCWSAAPGPPDQSSASLTASSIGSSPTRSCMSPASAGFGPAHIIFNMWALLLVGPSLERLLGRLRFLAVYLAQRAGRIRPSTTWPRRPRRPGGIRRRFRPVRRVVRGRQAAAGLDSRQSSC